MNGPPWEEIDHTADWALRARGPDRRALFEHAAQGMLSLLGGKPADAITTRRQIVLTAPDYETLLVDWLTELLYMMEDGSMLISSVQVHRVEDLSLEAEVEGGPPREPPGKHIKAVTYHLLAIRQTAQGYETVIVFDV